jgi:integrase
MAKRKTKPTTRGIRQRADGSYQVHKMIAGVRAWESFPAGTAESVMVKWREDQAAKKPAPLETPAAGSFAADIVEYGKRRAALRTIGSAVFMLDRWALALGRGRHRNTIAPDEIEKQLQTWQIAGMHHATARNYVLRLQSFYQHLNGKGGPNPARLATKPPRPKYDEPRAIPYDVIMRILGAMHARRTSGAVALTAVRVKVIAYTGIPPGVLAKLRPTHIDLAGAIVHLPPRLKGAGVEARSIPLTTQGVAAFRALIKAKACGPFSDRPLNKAFRRAAVACGLVDERGAAAVHVYDLRHSFGTFLYQLTRDLETVGRFLGHAKGSPATARYALGANRAVDQAAAAAVSARLAAIAAEQSRQQAPAPHAVA